MGIKSTGLTVDGVLYDVLIQFDTLEYESEKVVASSGVTIGNVIDEKRLGTRLIYSLVIDPKPKKQSDYDDLRAVLADPTTPTHTFTLPHIDTTISFSGIVLSGTDHFGGVFNGVNIWRGLEIQIDPVAPQIT